MSSSDERVKATVSLDELPCWDDLAYALKGELHNNEMGCSGEYLTWLVMPDGTVITERDTLVVLNGDPVAAEVDFGGSR